MSHAAADSANGAALKDEQDNLEHLRSGQEEAWTELLEQLGPRLMAYLIHRLPTQQDAEDVLAETFSAAVLSIRNATIRQSLATWLFGIASHKVADFWRKNENEERLTSTLQADETLVSLEFREALQTLPVDLRRVLVLRYACGLEVAEVAHLIHRSYRATETLLFRARLRLRRALHERGGGAR